MIAGKRLLMDIKRASNGTIDKFRRRRLHRRYPTLSQQYALGAMKYRQALRQLRRKLTHRTEE